MKIKVLGTGCARCRKLYAEAEKAIAAAGVEVFGVVSAPCAAPILVVLLTYLAGAQASVPWGGLLLLVYALGHSVLILLAGTSMGLARGADPRLRRMAAGDAQRVWFPEMLDDLWATWSASMTWDELAGFCQRMTDKRRAIRQA